MLYEGLSFKEYCELPGINQSKLKVIRRSLAHFRCSLDYEHKPTESQQLGNLFDVLVLTPERFNEEFTIVEKVPRANSAAYIELVKSANGKALIDKSDYDTACKMRDTLMSNSLASGLLEGAKKQIAITWQIDGIDCKGRPDAFSPNYGALIDLKSTRDARPYQFARDAEKFGYFHQIEFYRQGMYYNSIPVDHCFFIAQESSAPYGVVVHEVKEPDLAAVRLEIADLINTYKYAVDTNSWPCYAEVINTLERPKYGTNYDT